MIIIASKTITKSLKTAIDFGADILLLICERHPESVKYVVDQLICRVTSNSSNIDRVTFVLTGIVEKHANSEHLVCAIKETLTYLPALALPVAEDFLPAILPVCQNNQDLMDRLMLTLRKGMFSKVCKPML